MRSAEDRRRFTVWGKSYAPYEPCDICGKRQPFGKVRLYRDHNAFTGQRRGHLCVLCNGGLGMFQDNPGLMEKAAAYIRKWNAVDDSKKLPRRRRISGL